MITDLDYEGNADSGGAQEMLEKSVEKKKT